MEQAGDVAPGLPALDAPVPQVVDKLEDVLKIVDLCVPAQEIEVPKISTSPGAGHLGRGGEAKYPSGLAPDGEARS